MTDAEKNLFETKLEAYIEILKPLFLPDDPVSHDIINYFASLLRVVGMEDSGWDPYTESRAAIEDLDSFLSIDLPDDSFPSPSATRLRVALLLYAHVVEMNAPYEVLTNLLRFRLGKGYSPSPFFQFISKKERKAFRNRGIPTGYKIDIIRDLCSKAGLYEIGTIFDAFYDNRLRNSIGHSDYILTNNDFRCRGGQSHKKAFRIPYKRLHEMLTAASAFIAAYFHVEREARHVWGRNKQQAVPYDPHYKGMLEILVDARDLMCGFCVHWPNGSQSTYRRTDNGIDMTNCLVNLENASIELVVGQYARVPGEFSPLVERESDPVYSNLDACDVVPTWPTKFMCTPGSPSD